ncbi:MAG: hypothetical protein PHX27_01390 [Candidatus ainarchaeum sp.]|nr:hypothetical protein [Candidatus ainarchaeum sp.]
MANNNFFDNIIQKIKNTYYFFEDKWYNTLDKIDPKIPVYKVIDPIDDVMPSFILFLLTALLIFILIFYLIQFTSPLDLTFKVYDSTTNATLNGVVIQGILNKQDIDVLTTQNGTALTTINSSQKNIYAIFSDMLFGAKEEFTGNITAKKVGYKNQNSELATGVQEKTILLEPIPSETSSVNSVWAKVKLADLETNLPIKDNTAYVKFECSNKSITLKTVKDDSDGAIDGIFFLSEDNCDFVVKEAGANGYIKNSTSTNIPRELITNIELEKTLVKEKGGARISVTKKGSNGTIKLQGILINFLGNGKTQSATTLSNGIATIELDEGTYNIQINDSNYYPITSDKNINIKIESKKETALNLELELIPEELKRKVFVKIVDTNGPVSMAEVNFYRTRKDGNTQTNFNSDGSLIPPINNVSNRTDSNGLLEVKSFNDLDSKKVLGIIKKPGYHTKLFVPNIVPLDNTYEIITITKATPQNSANILIKTSVGESNALIAGINTKIYNEITFEDIKFFGSIDSKDTNSTGMSYYTELEPGNFFSSAFYKNIFLISDKNTIKAEKTHEFNFHFNTNVSKIAVILKDWDTKKTISNQNIATVKLFEINTDNTLSFIKNMGFSENQFLSDYVGIDKKYYITIDLNAYSSNNIIIEKDSLYQGINLFNVELTKSFTYVDTNEDCDYDEEYILNKNGEYTCAKIYKTTNECEIDSDCSIGENCIMNDNSKKVCVELPVNCDSKIYAFNAIGNLECVDSCNIGTLINKGTYSICYDFNLPTCTTNTYKFDNDGNVLCIAPKDCLQPCGLQNIGKKNNVDILFCICNSEPLCPNGLYGWDKDNKLICGDECEGEWGRLNNVFICYPPNFPHSPDGAISIFYDNIYSNHEEMLRGTGALNNINYIDNNKEYWTSFRTVINKKNISCTDLLSMTKIAQAKITNIDSRLLPENISLKMESFSCDLNNLDKNFIRDANNYYFPTTINCNGSTKIRTGFEWNKINLPVQTYQFYNKQKIIKSIDNNDFIMQFRALQENNNAISETPLNKITLPIDQYFGDLVSGEITIGNNPKINLRFDDPTTTINMDSAKEEAISIKLFNGSYEKITDGNIKLFSYELGGRNDFKLNDVEAKGTLRIDGNINAILGSDFNLNSKENITFNARIASTQLNSSNQLVIVLEFKDSNNVSQRLVDVININTQGKFITLDSEFLAFVNNQTYSGKIYSGSNTPHISAVEIKVDRNCDDEIEEIINFNTQPNNDVQKIVDNQFETKLEGTYYLGDCLHVTVTPKIDAQQYVSVTKTEYARYHHSNDPALACVDIIQKGGLRNNMMQWGDTTELIVQNNCPKAINFRINTSLDCNMKTDEQSCNYNQGFVLAPNAEKIIIITGKNVDYNPEAYPNFTDRLGHYPVYVQAKFSDSRGNFVNADEFIVDLSNNKECFEISSSWFNLNENNKADFTITNYCQDPLNDYTYPSATLDSMGYTLEMPNQGSHNTPISFGVTFLVGGLTYSTQTLRTLEETIWGMNIIDKGILETKKTNCADQDQGTFCDYNMTVDLKANQFITAMGNDWNTDRIQIKISDIGQTQYGIGAKLNGSIKLNFVGGTNKIVSLNELTRNSTINPFKCGAGTGHCTNGSEDEIQADDGTAYYTTFYIPNTAIGTNKKVQSIELSLIGNQDTNNLIIAIMPLIKYIKLTQSIDLTSATNTTTSIPIGNFSIIPKTNINFIIYDLNRALSLMPKNFDNVKMDVVTTNTNVNAWVQGNFIMAKYLGNTTQSNPDKSGIINLRLNKSTTVYGMGTQFGIINIKDYVNITKAQSSTPSKQVSGAR